MPHEAYSGTRCYIVSPNKRGFLRRNFVAGLLEGIKILDLTRLLPGGYCSMLLADMGAECCALNEKFLELGILSG